MISADSEFFGVIDVKDSDRFVYIFMLTGT